MQILNKKNGKIFRFSGPFIEIPCNPNVSGQKTRGNALLRLYDCVLLFWMPNCQKILIVRFRFFLIESSNTKVQN